MNSRYSNPQLSFEYPENWELDESHSDEGFTVSVQSPDLMFVFVTLYENSRSPGEIADQALEAMRDEYPELESFPTSQRIANQLAVG